MQYNSFMEYPFTVDYFKTENTALSGNLPNWKDTLIKEIKIHVAGGSDTFDVGKMFVFCQESLVPGFFIKNFRDVNGRSILPSLPNNLGIDTSAWRIVTNVPVMNMFGYLEQFKMQVQPLSALRTS